MGLNSTKSSLTNAEYSLTLSSPNDFYRGSSIIQGEFNLNVRTKLRIEKEIRVDLIGQLIENKKFATRSTKNSSQLNNNNVFFTFPYVLVTSHENGTARTLKQQQVTYPFRIPLGINLPPSCDFKEFSIMYYLEIYHDGRLLPNTHKQIILAPPVSQFNVPLPCKVTGKIKKKIFLTIKHCFMVMKLRNIGRVSFFCILFLLHINLLHTCHDLSLPAHYTFRARNNMNLRTFLEMYAYAIMNSYLGSGDVTMVCGLQKSFYSGRDCPMVPLTMTITNPKQKQIKSVTAQLMQVISLNGIKRENEIFTAVLNEIAENTKENQVHTTCELVLPANLCPTYISNENSQPDNVPSIIITYEFRLTAQMKGATTPNLRLSVPLGIE
jgi:hypothetical protein